MEKELLDIEKAHAKIGKEIKSKEKSIKDLKDLNKMVTIKNNVESAAKKGYDPINTICLKDGTFFECDIGWIEGDMLYYQKYGFTVGIYLKDVDINETYEKSKKREQIRSIMSNYTIIKPKNNNKNRIISSTNRYKKSYSKTKTRTRSNNNITKDNERRSTKRDTGSSSTCI